MAAHDYACYREMLLLTDYSVTDIAPRCGFFTRYYLHRAFQAHFGMSPRQYRAELGKQSGAIVRFASRNI